MRLELLEDRTLPSASDPVQMLFPDLEHEGNTTEQDEQSSQHTSLYGLAYKTFLGTEVISWIELFKSTFKIFQTGCLKFYLPEGSDYRHITVSGAGTRAKMTAMS